MSNQSSFDQIESLLHPSICTADFALYAIKSPAVFEMTEVVSESDRQGTDETAGFSLEDFLFKQADRFSKKMNNNNWINISLIYFIIHFVILRVFIHPKVKQC